MIYISTTVIVDVRKVIVRENARVSIPFDSEKQDISLPYLPDPHQASNITSSTCTLITWYDGIVKRMVSACMQLTRPRYLAIDCYRISQAF
jgi:hypothetical protein